MDASATSWRPLKLFTLAAKTFEIQFIPWTEISIRHAKVNNSVHLLKRNLEKYINLRLKVDDALEIEGDFGIVTRASLNHPGYRSHLWT